MLIDNEDKICVVCKRGHYRDNADGLTEFLYCDRCNAMAARVEDDASISLSWIDATEQLPDDGETVLAHGFGLMDKLPYVYPATFRKPCDFWPLGNESDGTLREVGYWMNLPNGPT